MGRPPEKDPPVNPVALRLRASERELISKAAASTGTNLSAFIRDAAIEKAQLIGGTSSE
ncbi:DUF1778 domain-containing protein [Subtercola vilae]|uniref:DUF1778 domain-containing protein n=2 Tax=Subtercola vilae TaxID=2056433 RepID=A0A4T2BQ95_9MICO|nr:DUF1778 domain-containing protein [Subtercola vilae]